MTGDACLPAMPPPRPGHPPLTSLRSFAPPYASEGGGIALLHIPLDSRLRGNDVVVGNDDGVLGVDKGHDALFEVLDGF